MVLALQNPEMIARLIIADIAPVRYEHSQDQNIQIMQSIPLDQFDRRSAVEAELYKKTSDAGLAAFFSQSLSFDEQTPRWLLNLDALLQNMDDIIGFPHMSQTFANEALFITGGESEYVGPNTRAEVDRLFPTAVLKTIDDAGHWLHADKPREFMTILDTYLTAG